MTMQDPSSVAAALDSLPPTITVVQAAALLGIGRNSAYRAAAAGDLPTVRLGGRILVLTAPLRRLLGIEESAKADARALAEAS